MASSDVSAVTKYFPQANEGFISAIGTGGVSAGAATVPLTTVSGLTDATVFVGIAEPGETAQQVFTGTVDVAGSQITGVKWTRGTNVDHLAGSTVVDYVTGTAINMITTGILKEHNQDGGHGTITTDTINEHTAANGVTIASLNIKNGKINTAGSVQGNMFDTANQAVFRYTPVGNTDITSGAMTDFVTGFSNTTVPSWATKARVTYTVGFTCGTSSGDFDVRVVIGSDNGTTYHLTANSFPTGGIYYATFVDEITLTATGAKALKYQVQRTAGTGFLRSSSNHSNTVKIEYR